MKQQKADAYWKANLRLIFLCMSLWFLVSLGCGILWVETLNQFMIGGYKLGFWFSQQGSIFCFILIIFYYAYRMNRLDKEFDVDEE